MNPVQVITGARLHFGLICTRPSGQHRFGGIGLMLRHPCWRVSATPADTFACQTTSDEIRDRIQTLFPLLAKQTGLSGMHVSVDEELPLHQGLGAGTQLTLAVATAALIAAGQARPPSSATLATELNRMRRSAVGTFGFDRGGLIVDGGLPLDSSDRVLHSHEFPADWRVVLISPNGETGLSGAQEESAFQHDDWMSETVAQQQFELIHQTIVPATQQKDFQLLRDGMAEYGNVSGTYFSKQQGGVFSSQLIRELSEMAEFSELRPVQSSWGPTVAVFAQSDVQASEIANNVEQAFPENRLICHIAEPLNMGALVRTIAPEEPDHVVRG